MNIIKNLASKYDQRRTIANEISEIMEDGSDGTITINENVDIRYSSGLVEHFTYNDITYFLTKESMKQIFAIANIDVSVYLEEIFKICVKASRN